MKKNARKPRVLLGKIGLDGHSRGIYVVAHGLRQSGMEVIYTGIRQTAASMAHTAVQEDVDFIGISSMVGAHLSIIRKLREELQKLNASNIPVLIGGIIPEDDYDLLRAMGVEKIFVPGAEIKEIAECIRSNLEGPQWVPEIQGSLIGESLEELHLLGSKCKKCGQVYFPSRRNCPRCMDEKNIEHVTLSDKGTLQSYVVATVAPPGYKVPHAQGFIDIHKGGPRIFSLLTDYGDGGKLHIGCEMGLKIVECGRDDNNRVIVGYRFKPL